MPADDMCIYWVKFRLTDPRVAVPPILRLAIYNPPKIVQVLDLFN